jgi:hypothetical protein
MATACEVRCRRLEGVVVGKVSSIVVSSSAPVLVLTMVERIDEGGLRWEAGRVWYRVWKAQVSE